MKRFVNRRRERGVALLVAVFALLMLSAIGMAMMFSANTETSINANYREKQIATYAAMSGIQEAKDRLIQSTGDIAWMADLPDPSLAHVIYILNPRGGETVAPWNWQNLYADTELCHERTLGITVGAISDPCGGAGSMPATGTWYGTAPANAAYRGIDPPLDFKWVRIQLKANNNTPYAANGDTSNFQQVCWNGINQILRPPAYKTDCTPSGGISSITITDEGSNYTSTPTITIGAPSAGGTQATATAVVTNPSGQLSAIVVDTGGSGYTTAPVVQITGGGGSGAAATANIVGAGSPVMSLTRNDYGIPDRACWEGATAPTVNLTFTPAAGAPGAGAAGTATLTPGFDCISKLSFTSGTCTSDKGSNATITSGGGGFAATVKIPANGKLTTAAVSVNAPGNGYTSVNPPVTLDVGGHTPTCASVVAQATLGHTLTGVTLTAGGGGYTSSPTVGFNPGPNAVNSPSVTANLGGVSAGQVVSITLTNPGTGYTSLPTVTLVGGCGAGLPPPACPTTATAHAIFPGIVSAINITNYGAGYTAVPTVTIGPPGAGGTNATAVAHIQGGSYYSPVFLLTALGVSPNGARSMVQAEVAPAIRALNLPGALTLAGPNPDFGAPNSNPFFIEGNDHPNGFDGTTPPAPGCDTTPSDPHPSIGVYDNPNAPTSPTSVVDVLTAIPAGRADDHYPGLHPSPDVENVYGALGDQGSTPQGLEDMVTQIASVPGRNLYPNDPGSIALGSATAPVINVVQGDLTLTGNNTGYGILVVTGTLEFRGNFTWNGLVLVIGQGNVQFSGGGSGTINGSVFVAKTRDNAAVAGAPWRGNQLATLGSPRLDWSGGGGNGIYYDHCWADAMLNMIPFSVPASTRPLTVLSIKTLTY